MMRVIFTGLLLIFWCAIASSQNLSINYHDRPDSLATANQQLARFIQLKQGETLVDIGTGDMKKMLAVANQYPNNHFYLEDIDSTRCSQACFQEVLDSFDLAAIEKGNIHIILGTIQSTTLPSNTFDKVCFTSVLHGLDDKHSLIEEAKRILKPTGTIIIGEGLSDTLKNKHGECDLPYFTIDQFEAFIKEEELIIIKDWKIDMRSEIGAVARFVELKW